MFASVLAFEIRYHLKSRLFLFGWIVFFLLMYLGVASPNVQLGPLGGANYNSPFAIVQAHIVMAMIGVLVGTAFLNSAALRDNEQRMAEIVYSTRITRTAYVIARFIGAFIATYLVYVGASVGFAVGSFMPWLDQELIGPFVFNHYLYASLLIGLPALFANSAIVYAVAVLSRDNRISYAVIVALLVLYQVAASMLGRFEFREAAGLIDPSGAGALGEFAQYWTVFERNTELVPIEGTLLYNRIIWIGIGLLMLAITLWRFEFMLDKARKKKKKLEAGEEVDAVLAPADFAHDAAVFTPATGWHQYVARTRFEVKGVVKSVFFWVLIALAVMSTLGNFFALSQIFGTTVYPVTRSLINLMSGTVTLSLMIVIVFYGADLVWRDRDLRFQEILGSTPTPNWSFVLAKMTAAVLVVAAVLFVSAVVAVLFQLFNGYTRIEPGLYLLGFFYDYGLIFYLAVVLSVVIQIIVPNKYFGMLFMVLYILALIALPNAGFEDPLYIYGSTSATRYSDMNGWGSTLGWASWYSLYWICFATLLGLLGYLLWTRGPQEKLRTRLRNIGANLSRPAAALASVAGTGFVVLLVWIFYNTHVLNTYYTSDDQRAFTAGYEKAWVHLKGQPIPTITDVSLEIDLYPEQRAFAARGELMIENKTDGSIATLPVGFGFQTVVDSVEIEGAALVEKDESYNVHQFEFEPPLAPGERRRLTYATSRTPKGFRHRRNIEDLLFGGGGVFANGTFINSFGIAPYLGFNEGLILNDRNARWREGLEPVPRFPDLDDEEARQYGFLKDSHWVSFKATVTTSADQVAIAPGYLIEDTVEGDRRRLVYEMDAPMQNFYAVLSARYASKVEDWNGIRLSVFYHPEHDWNVDRIIKSLKDSISYFSREFSPYQYRQMRVLEFPAYATFAQSFPNTVPWSETIGFIADISDPEDIDYVYYVGAHEVAHQWWAHQVSSANVQGQSSLIETLSQYSALMVMEDEYGPHLMRRFLKYELDNYLSNRGGEAIEEMPLYRVENQGYIHYRKGSIAMYALKDYLGEDAVNRALRNLVEEMAYKYDPYPTSRDLLRHLRAEATTDAQQQLITDMFEKIVLWDLRVEDVEVSERDDGRFDVDMTISATKFEADGQGEQTEVPLDMPIDIGAFTMNPDKATEGDAHVLLLEKQPVRSGEQTISITVDERPSHVGIDPYNKLIDRNSDDNLERVN